VIGIHDYGTGLDAKSFRVVADFDIDNVAAGMNLAERFQPTAPGVWEWKLKKPVTDLPGGGRLTVSIADKQGNVTRIERRFKVGK
jgi:hypothetical protein